MSETPPRLTREQAAEMLERAEDSDLFPDGLSMWREYTAVIARDYLALLDRVEGIGEDTAEECTAIVESPDEE